MVTSSDISVGLAHEFIITACKAGFEAKDFAVLAQSEEKLREVLTFVRGYSEIKQIDHIIDCDADPFVPEGWKVEEHKKMGQWKWGPTKVIFYLSENQKNGHVEGNELRKELADKLVLNANVLDYLLVHPHLIPEEWKEDDNGNTRYIFFWGTIYRNSGGLLFVRCLYFVGGKCHWYYFWLGLGWDDNYPAALLAS